MARKKKAEGRSRGRPPKDTSGWTKPRQFRLSEETLAELDRLAEHLTRETGVIHSRTDAIRYAARHTVKALGLARQEGSK
jgi:hypothetical protein